MLIYILKSTAIAATLLFFYKFLIERESFHRFKRFFLLSIILFSILIPSVTYYEYVEATQLNQTEFGVNHMATPSISDFWNNIYFKILVQFLYLTGLFFFGFRFFNNLVKLYKKVHNNQQIKSDSFTYILLDIQEPPHTFFNYIFLNKEEYYNNSIPKEILKHEETHAIQRHSVDILFIELLQVVFWFNPTIYVLKQAIKLNHEFLADSDVLTKGYNRANYQNLLLNYSTIVDHIPLVNSIHYSLIKKRFIIMKTKTSKLKSVILQFTVVPLIVILFYGFSTKEISIIEKSTNQVLKYSKGTSTLDTIPESPPPPPPTPNQKTIEQGSKELQEAFQKFRNSSGKYAKSVKNYSQTNKGYTKLIEQYDEVMKRYESFKLLAEKEGVITPPPPPPVAPEKENYLNRKTGFIEKNGKTIFYVKDDKGIAYYDKYGSQVDKEGNYIIPE